MGPTRSTNSESLDSAFSGSGETASKALGPPATHLLARLSRYRALASEHRSGHWRRTVGTTAELRRQLISLRDSRVESVES